MIFEGQQEVIEAIKEKKRLRDAGAPHGHIRPMLFIDGGLMKGVYGVGACWALEELGYTDIFSHVVGISSGAPTAAYFLAGELEKGMSLVWNEGCSRKYINMWRFWKQVNYKHFIGAIKTSPVAQLSIDSIITSPSKLHIGVAEFRTGEPYLIGIERADQVYDAIYASILMPNISSDVVTFNDIRYVDGGFTRPHALKIALEEIDATHVLVMANQDKTITTIPRLERFLNHTLYRHRMPRPLRFAAHERKRERMKVVAEMENGLHMPYALVWGDHSIKSMERNPKVVKEVVEKSKQWWLTLMQ